MNTERKIFDSERKDASCSSGRSRNAMTPNISEGLIIGRLQDEMKVPIHHMNIH